MSTLMSIRRCARVVRKRPAWISEQIATGKIPGYREPEGRTIRVDLNDVIALIKSHRVGTNTVPEDSDHARSVVGAVLAREASK